MKYRATQKEIRDGFNAVIAVPYCSLQSLLTFESPIAYTVRREGWGADIYDVGNGVAIVTGYAPFGNYTARYGTTNVYEDRALRCLTTHSYNEAKSELRYLISEFVEEVTGLKRHADTTENKPVSD